MPKTMPISDRSLSRGRTVDQKQALQPREVTHLPVVSHFECPVGMRLRQMSIKLLLFVYLNPGLPFDQWPPDLIAKRSLAALCGKRMLIKRKLPTRYYVSRGSYGLASLLAKMYGLKRANLTQ